MRTLVVALAVLPGILSSACERDPQGADCVCQPQTALGTPFDNGSSMLGAGNVQDALDELAARPLAGSMYFTDWSEGEPAAGVAGFVISRPCNDNPGDIALSVTCEFAEGGTPDPTVVPVLE